MQRERHTSWIRKKSTFSSIRNLDEPFQQSRQLIREHISPSTECNCWTKIVCNWNLSRERQTNEGSSKQIVMWNTSTSFYIGGRGSSFSITLPVSGGSACTSPLKVRDYPMEAPVLRPRAHLRRSGKPIKPKKLYIPPFNSSRS